MFDEFDTDRSGDLDLRELADLVRRIIPEVTKSEVRYFACALDVNGDGR